MQMQKNFTVLDITLHFWSSKFTKIEYWTVSTDALILINISLSGTKNEKWARVVGLLITLFPPTVSISMSNIQYLPMSIVGCLMGEKKTNLKQIKSLIICFRQYNKIHLFTFNEYFWYRIQQQLQRREATTTSIPPLLFFQLQPSFTLSEASVGLWPQGGQTIGPQPLYPIAVWRRNFPSEWDGPPSEPNLKRECLSSKLHPRHQSTWCQLISTFSNMICKPHCCTH